MLRRWKINRAYKRRVRAQIASAFTAVPARRTAQTPESWQDYYPYNMARYSVWADPRASADARHIDQA